MAWAGLEGGGGRAFSLAAVGKGTALSFSLTLGVAALLGLAAALTQWEGLRGGFEAFSYACVGLGGMLAGRSSRRWGWMHGGAVGLLYFAISAALFQEGFSWSLVLSGPWLLRAVWDVGAGAAGGILGVNL